MTDFNINFCGASVSYKPKLQPSTSLSSEAEYISIADVVKEILYVRNVLWSLDIHSGFPVMVEVDNIGAIYLANNAGSSIRTKHVDIQFHFVREYCENGATLVRFISTI